MTIDPSQLLKKLEPAVRPTSAPAPRGAARLPLEEKGFDELLQLVSAGSISSDRAVSVGASANTKQELEPEQLARLAAAADHAEASGAQRAVMLIDGRGLIMDIASREIAAELSADSSHKLINIDAAVYVAGEDEETASSAVTAPPGVGIIPPALAQQFELARHERTAPDGADTQQQSSTRRAG